MRENRIYEPIELLVGAVHALSQENYHHIIKVLRMKVGNPLTIFDGEGGSCESIIEEISKKSCKVKIIKTKEQNNNQPENYRSVNLAICIIKADRIDFIIEKATEMDVNSIRLINSTYSGFSKISSKISAKMAHWNKIAISACAQSKRNKLPKILPPINFSEYVQEVTSQKQANNIILMPSNGVQEDKKQLNIKNPINILVGPEGGFSTEEIALTEGKFSNLSLGKNILRTETAAIAATAWVHFYHEGII